MGASVPRSLVEAFYQAYSAHDAKTVAEFLDDDVEWTISGPVDVLPFCGTRHGKAAVLDIIERLVPHVFCIFSFVRGRGAHRRRSGGDAQPIVRSPQRG